MNNSDSQKNLITILLILLVMGALGSGQFGFNALAPTAAEPGVSTQVQGP